jgi:copper chaperone CopZ
MKKIIVVLMMLGSLSVFAEEIKIQVNGMVCSMCAQGIEKKFKAHPAVHHLDVNLNEKVVFVHTKDGEALSDKEITQFITEAGYNVAEISRK